jgi:putative membrane protein
MPTGPLKKSILFSAISAGSAAVLLYLAGQLTHGILSHHMLTHIALMSLVAPAIAVQLWLPLDRRRSALGFRRFVPLWLATSAQIGLFVGWHSPPALQAGITDSFTGALMQWSLLAVATLFWLILLLRIEANRWGAIFALLLTGKVFCLIGALLVFAPRLLFVPDFASLHPDAGFTLAQTMADQQLAGLLMLTACPLTYLLASIGIVGDWLFKTPRQASPCTGPQASTQTGPSTASRSAQTAAVTPGS